MLRLLATLSLIALLALGSGGVAFFHHHLEDSHDESTCPIHAQLGAPMLPSSYVPLLILLGLFVAFLTLLPQSAAGQFVHIRLDCRGPPVRALPAA